MKPLFICNPSQVSTIISHIEKNQIFGSVEQKKKPLGDDESKLDIKDCFITSQEECEARRNDYIGVGDAPSTRIYIDPFLEWGKEDYYGYHIALDILTNWKKKEAPGLVFLSAIQQKAFDKLVKGKLNSFVREFIHFDFLDLDSKVLPYSTFSTSRWKYLKAYAITRAGKLDDLSHELDTPANSKNPSRSDVENIIDKIKNIPETVGKSVLQLCNEYHNEVDVSAFAKALQDQIKEQIKELKPHEPSAIEIPASMNILIVEDNVEHLAVLENALTERQGYFEKDKNLFSFTNGDEALQELKKSPNEYQLVLVDLRLNDENGFAQPVHGVDIIEELQKNHPLSSYTIITGMGRRGVAELLDIDLKFILSKKNLYSFDTESEVDKMLSRMIGDVAQREKSIHYNYGPNNGVYDWTMFKTNLFALGSERLKEQQAIALEKLEAFKNKMLAGRMPMYAAKNKKQYDINKIDEYHINILTIRLIYLWLALKNKNKLTCDNDAQDEFTAVLTNCGNLTISDSKASLIGLTREKIGFDEKYGKEIIQIDLNDLWPHEYAVVDEWNTTHNESLYDRLNDLVISEQYPSLFQFILRYFDYEEEELNEMKTDLPSNLKIWNFNELGAFLTEVFKDVLKQKESSIHFPYVEAMCKDEFVMNYFQDQIAPHLEELDRLFFEVYRTI